MKGILSKSLSSPGRAAEKFSTPLMLRFLRTNVGSRSRGRSRSSPMFILRSSASKKNGGNTGPAAINETHQEPSSPKVTCIGQVRVKRSSKSKQKKKTHSEKPTSCSCCCCSGCSCCGFFSRTRFCCNFCPRFQKPRSICRNLRKWGWFFRFGYCKKVDTGDDSSSSSRFGSNFRSGRNHVSSEIEDDNGERRNVMKGELVSEIKVGFLQKSSYSSPPKNALLLTRCRSAPYRSSSLASRFWGSPLKESETETPKENEDENEEDDDEEGGMGRPVSPNLENEEAESRTNDKNHEEDEENSSRNEESKDLNFQDLGEKTTIRESSSTIHPVLLIRCKSEPARTGERLMNPEANFLLTRRRSDTAESCLNLPQIHC